MQIIDQKLLLIGFSILINIFVGLIPLALTRRRSQQLYSPSTVRLLRVIIAMTTGAFLGVCMLRLFPELRNSTLALAERLDQKRWEYPLAEVTILAGFFLFWFIAEVLNHLHQREATRVMEEDSTTSLIVCMTEPLVGVDESLQYPIILLIFAFYTKSALDGLAIGSMDNTINVLHEGSAELLRETFSVGLLSIKISQTSWGTVLCVIVVTSYSFVHGLALGMGAAFGPITTAAATGAILTFQALSAGALLYIVFFSFLLNDMKNDLLSKETKIGCIVGGFLIIALLRGIHNAMHFSEFGMELYNTTETLSRFP